ncbi:endonuclease/exonuclease/phosphatase family protein [uncultured Algibacter sp.]|uniref:endonuclease/exonuclease/phosphatase family protein n=1 Tax=uncultured Algibacter sp. TaxID=298659 RepID=UPI002618AC95|nr:endonuclease/exonuclease/phosphatase family protein [uncultured Algibacter sp.]
MLKSLNLNESSSRLTTLSILSYNAHGFKGIEDEIKTGESAKIVNFIENKDTDVFCIQEFSAIQYKYFSDYPYFFKTNIIAGKKKSVMAIFSKYPITNKEYISFPNSRNGAMFVDLVLNEEKVRIYNVHLESYKVSDISNLSNPKSGYSVLIGKIGVAERTRKEQALLLKKHINEFKGRVIICGDFNSTQFSSSYRIIKGLKKDTFIEAGIGLGKTYEFFKYPFRLDYILVDDSFEVLSHESFDLKYSDHEPILSKLVLN